MLFVGGAEGWLVSDELGDGDGWLAGEGLGWVLVVEHLVLRL